MNKWLELLLGLILVVGAVILALGVWPSWWPTAWEFLKGGVFWGVVGIGALLILLGITDLKD